MKITRIISVSFSPAGSTEEITRKLAGQIAASVGLPSVHDSFTLPKERIEKRLFSSSDLVLFSVPTYAGRIPNKILPSVQSLFSGEDTPVIPIVTFGNRAFDNSLKELRNELREHGFCPIAAAAIVSRHVFSKTLGQGRPDCQDQDQLQNFAESISESIKKSGSVRDFLFPALPDDALPVGPYYTPLDEEGHPAKFLKATPVTDMNLCDSCGLCANVCPMGSVSREHPEEMTGICIKCQACILKCPKHARHFDDPVMLSHTRMLEKNYGRRAEMSLFPPIIPQGTP